MINSAFPWSVFFLLAWLFPCLFFFRFSSLLLLFGFPATSRDLSLSRSLTPLPPHNGSVRANRSIRPGERPESGSCGEARRYAPGMLQLDPSRMPVRFNGDNGYWPAVLFPGMYCRRDSVHRRRFEHELGGDYLDQCRCIVSTLPNYMFKLFVLILHKILHC